MGSYFNDSIYSENGEGFSYEVKIIVLDDFVEYIKLVLNLLKMDIEGVEFDVIKGLEKMLVFVKFYLVLEI